MSSSACLVVSPPEYEKPQPTAPFLVPSDAVPDLRCTIPVDDETDFVEFGGSVVSEDNGLPVHLALYIDYGDTNAADLPYRNVVYPFEPLPAGTLAEGPRKFTGKRWHLGVIPLPTDGDCHTVTLMATHEFDARVCPANPSDASFLVWQVTRCPTGSPCSQPCEPKDCVQEPCTTCSTPPADAGAGGAP
jgi:hypothetical protein